jgi:hypothetical protein
MENGGGLIANQKPKKNFKKNKKTFKKSSHYYCFVIVWFSFWPGPISRLPS